MYENLVENLKYKKPCEMCGILIEKTPKATTKKYCEKCAKIIKNEQNKSYYRKNR